GTPGESRGIKLELKLIADVGLLGLPNAGKSTLISKVSAAKPKIADYPFTTLVPNLGVVKVDAMRSFVLADIPGLIEGASEGQGLGIRFLKHLTRNRILLHLIDVAPFDESDAIENALSIERELQKFSPALANRERWLVLNKVDLLQIEQVEELKEKLVEALKWKGPIFMISAATGEGVSALCQKIMQRMEEITESLSEDGDAAEAERQYQTQHKQSSQKTSEDDDDDYDVEVVYVND
ncbi:UNVERIFIED_CONTAM: hypothetical protein GTU68_020038, partial [Idotea baltica]|nr:hypothetical protein [Idotea baltica]